MNLASQIRSAAAAASKPACRSTSAGHPRLQNLLRGGPSQSAKAFSRYKAVMVGKGWMTQRQIENALGYASTVSTDYLAKLLAAEAVERRNKGGSPTFQRRIGYEWRWKEC